MRALGPWFLATCALGLACAVMVSAACDQQTRSPVVEESMPEIRPNLPPIPKVPPPRHPIQYEDGTYSVYGLRKRIRQTMDEEIRVKAYIVKIFEPTPCPEGRTCPPPPMPHLWLGDDMDETSERRLLRLVGFANSQLEMEEERERQERGEQPTEEQLAAGLPPIIYDWQLGKRYVIKGRFARTSGTGFSYSEGLLEYMEHECLDCPPPEEDERGAKRR